MRRSGEAIKAETIKSSGRVMADEMRSGGLPGSNPVDWPSGVASASMSAGKTIQTGKFKFVRVDIGLEFQADDISAATKAADTAVFEVLAREVASVEGERREADDGPLEAFGELAGPYVVWVEYGLTDPKPNMGSARVSAGVRAPFPKGHSISEAIRWTQTEAEGRVGALRAKHGG
tara:strand:+ start:6288 stop:6815 length:528 start_codon:yes stop_codon:yes gene_type:complete